MINKSDIYNINKLDIYNINKSDIYKLCNFNNLFNIIQNSFFNF